MLKKFSAGFVLVATLTMCMGIVNTAFVNFASASEEKKCKKCGHLPSECAKTDCKCDCQKPKH